MSTEVIEYEWVLLEVNRMPDGSALVAASGTAPDLEDARKEAAHYAMQYAQDGPVEVALYEVTRRRVA